MSEKQSISIIGSTGSIGTQALNIIRKRPNEFTVIALSAKQNLSILTEQIKEFKPKYVHIEDLSARAILKEIFQNIEFLNSTEEVAEIDNVDIFLSAIVGIAGLQANLKALSKAKKVAIANKETLVVADHLVTAIQLKYSVTLIPIDSEHAAIHQCLCAGAKDFNLSKNSLVKEILLTSSGGPFRDKTREELEKVTLKEALQHPTWSMGRKITIDSSTLMNKALEVIEVHALFKIPYEKIKVVIHPQSIVHSAVSFIDGNIIAQLGSTNMEIPIQYAIDYPYRKELAVEDTFNIFGQSWDFMEPNFTCFPLLKLGYEVGKLGHSYPTVFNAANEAAVELFLNEKIKWSDIEKLISNAITNHKIIINPSLEEILDLDREVKKSTKLLARLNCPH
ncbi:MAG: 1-deoxy-D-xylulose-5-phosphate reductoisomerase [Candidatus Melainabacteria bacterium]|nr:1-deoxy-D-xylulose-5-phosphate reductoisomerase [Candidatus Melainabacteria bacterium]